MKVEELRKELKTIFNEKFENIDTDFEKYKIKTGLGFFPYGTGLLQNKDLTIPENGILILGKDFGSRKYFEKIKDNGEAENATLKKVIDLTSRPSKTNTNQ